MLQSVTNSSRPGRTSDALEAKCVNSNLYIYCSSTFETCRRWCVAQRSKIAERLISKKIGFFDRRRLKGLAEGVKQRAESDAREKARANSKLSYQGGGKSRSRDVHINYKSIVYKDFVVPTVESMSTDERQKLESACETLIDIISTIYQYNDASVRVKIMRKGWSPVVEYCQVVVESRPRVPAGSEDDV